MNITVGNTRCAVDGTTEERAILQGILSIDTGRYNPRGGGNIIHRFFHILDKSFPTGLLSKVLESPAVRRGEFAVKLADDRTRLTLPVSVVAI